MRLKWLMCWLSHGLLVLCCTRLSAQVALAETGKTDDVVDISLVQGSGLLTPLSPHALSLQALSVDVQLDGEDFAIVTASYTLRNTGPADEVSMGIPVDVVHRLPFYTGDWAAEHLPDLRVMLDGEELAVRTIQTSLGIRKGYPRFRHWFRVEVPVPADSSIRLQVDYRIRMELNDVVPLAGGEAEPSPRIFTLSLHPDTASFQAIPQLDLHVDASLLHRVGVPLQRVLPKSLRADTSADGRGQYTAKIPRARLDSLGSLVLQYDVREYVKSAPYRIPFPAEQLVAATAGAASQDAGLTLDANRATFWRSDSTIANAWVEYEVKDLPLATVAILNGCPGTAAPGWAEEVLATATCLDQPKAPGAKVQRTVRLKTGANGPLQPSDVAKATQTLLTITNPPGEHWRVRIQVLKRFPGQRTTCLPEVFLLP